MRLLAVSIWSVFDEGIKRNDTIGHFTSDTLVWTIDKSSCESRQNCASLSLQFNIISHSCLLDKKSITNTEKKKGVYKVSQLYIHLFLSSAEAGGFEPPVQLPVRKFSKLVVSATHPHFL